MIRRGKRFADTVALSAIALGVIVAVGVGLLLSSLLRSPPVGSLDHVVGVATEQHRFSLLGFELTHLPNRLLSSVAGWINEPEHDEAEVLSRWFAGDADSDRKAAETMLERRLSEAIVQLELDTPLPLFGDIRIVWPPVDMDLSEPLRVLAISPRDEVRLEQSVLLVAGLSADEITEIEATVEADGRWSAWVQTVGGVALYPAFIVEGRNFESTLDVMGHEWVHHYLGFHPLGLSYWQGSDMRTINETVADIVGYEIGATAVDDDWFGDPAPTPNETQSVARTVTDLKLRNLRLEVDRLLSVGLVEVAERRMEVVRQELANVGRTYRRINQAFLAFRGGYGASGSSASPWGKRLLTLRASSESAADFMHQVRGVSSADEALALTGR